MFSDLLRKFMTASPVCVAARAAVEHLLGDQWLDDLFNEHSQAQYQHQLLFSKLTTVMSQVVSGQKQSVHRAYLSHKASLGVSPAALYQKLNLLEPQLCVQLLRQSAAKAQAVIDHLHLPPPLLANLEVRIVDGNHFARSEHRIRETRNTRSGPLPAQALVVMDPRRKLMLEMVPCENAHSQERSLLPQLLEMVGRGQLWLADRNFCTTLMLFGLLWREAYFLIRQHASTLVIVEEAELRPAGSIEAGEVFQRRLRIVDPQSGRQVDVRQITLKLRKPTRNGQKQIVLLSNVPAEMASACRLAELYKDRWQVEQAFCEMSKSLACEVRTLGYPRAAIFAFCLGLATYNAYSILRSALAAAHGQQKVQEEISFHHMALDLAEDGPGMMKVVDQKDWRVFAQMSSGEFARTIKDILKQMELWRYQKFRRGERKPRPPRSSGAKNHHVATWKLLQKRKQKANRPKPSSSAGP